MVNWTYNWTSERIHSFRRVDGERRKKYAKYSLHWHLMWQRFGHICLFCDFIFCVVCTFPLKFVYYFLKNRWRLKIVDAWYPLRTSNICNWICTFFVEKGQSDHGALHEFNVTHVQGFHCIISHRTFQCWRHQNSMIQQQQPKQRRKKKFGKNYYIENGTGTENNCFAFNFNSEVSRCKWNKWSFLVDRKSHFTVESQTREYFTFFWKRKTTRYPVTKTKYSYLKFHHMSTIPPSCQLFL